MVETVQFGQVIIDKINDCISKSKAGAEMHAYTEAGGKLREACELFSTMILNAFLGETATANCFKLDDKLKMLRERKCLEKKEVDLLYEIKEYGNNTVHSDKNENFNVEEINDLIPSFESLFQDYISNTDSKYKSFLERAKSGEAEAFKKMDRYITKALQLYTDNWFKKYAGYKAGEKHCVFKIELSSDELSDNDKIEIKKNLYLATREYMALLCRVSQINVVGDDYGRLQAELLRYNTSNYKAGALENYNACFEYPKNLKCKSNELDLYYKGSNNEIVYANNATFIQKNSRLDSYELRKKYEIKTYYLPDEVNALYYDNDKILWAKQRIKNGYESQTDKATSRLSMKSVDDFIFTKIRMMCEGSLSGETTWNSDIYDYARMIHQAIERTKAGFGSKYSPNPLSEIISKTDNCIIEEEDKAYSEAEEKLEELEQNLNIKQDKEKIENTIETWKEQLEDIKNSYLFHDRESKKQRASEKSFLIALIPSLSLLILCILNLKVEMTLWSLLLLVLIGYLIIICCSLIFNIVKLNKNYKDAMKQKEKLKREYNSKRKLVLKTNK